MTGHSQLPIKDVDHERELRPREQSKRQQELMDSTAFVGSCLIISMIAAQNHGRREAGRGVVGLVKGSGKLV